MILDIILAATFLIETIRGKNRGFSGTLLRLLSLGIALLAGSVLTGHANELLEAIGVRDFITSRIDGAMNAPNFDIMSIVPQNLASFVTELGEEHQTLLVNRLSGVAMSILSFALVVFAVNLIFSAIRRHMKSARRRHTLIGSADAFAGMILGMLKGVLVIFIILALIYPVTGLLAPEYMSKVIYQMDTSYIARRLYDINPLLIFIKSLQL